MWRYIFGVPKVIEEEKKEKNPKAWFKGEQEEQDGDVFGVMASWLAVATAWLISLWERGWWGSKLSGEWKLIRVSAFWGLLAQMASALKIKCPTLLTGAKRLWVGAKRLRLGVKWLWVGAKRLGAKRTWGKTTVICFNYYCCLLQQR